MSATVAGHRAFAARPFVTLPFVTLPFRAHPLVVHLKARPEAAASPPTLGGIQPRLTWFAGSATAFPSTDFVSGATQFDEWQTRRRMVGTSDRRGVQL